LAVVGRGDGRVITLASWASCSRGLSLERLLGQYIDSGAMLCQLTTVTVVAATVTVTGAHSPDPAPPDPCGETPDGAG
jgi:hypothetical protein